MENKNIEEPHNLYTSKAPIRLIKIRRASWVGMWPVHREIWWGYLKGKGGLEGLAFLIVYVTFRIVSSLLCPWLAR